MTIDEINARIKYISGQLDKDNPRRMTEGPFSEADKSVRDAYTREMELLEEEQIELFKLKDALEAAAPGEGEQLVANILSAYPIGGKRSKSVVGTVLGEELGALSEEGLAKAGSIEERLNLLRAPETETRTLYHRGPQGIEQLELRPDRFGTDKNALFFFDKPQKSGFGEALYEVEASLPEGSSIKIGSPPKELIEKLDAEIVRTAGEPGAKTELNQLRGVLKGNKWFGGTSESRQVLREQGQVRSLTSRQSDFLLNQGVKHLEGINVRGIPGFFQNTTSIVLDPDILNIMGVDGVPVAKEAEEGIMSLIGDTPTDMEEFQQFVSDSSALTEEELAGMSIQDSLERGFNAPREDFDIETTYEPDLRFGDYDDSLETTVLQEIIDSDKAITIVEDEPFEYDMDPMEYMNQTPGWNSRDYGDTLFDALPEPGDYSNFLIDKMINPTDLQEDAAYSLGSKLREDSQLRDYLYWALRKGDQDALYELAKNRVGEDAAEFWVRDLYKEVINVVDGILPEQNIGPQGRYFIKPEGDYKLPGLENLTKAEAEGARDWLLSKRGEFIKSYKAGGYVMNYGDYGRSYK